MKKIFSLALMATALLISGQVKAVNVAQVGDQQFPSVYAAIQYINTNNINPATIDMLEASTETQILYFDGGKTFTWNFNGKTVTVDGTQGTDAAWKANIHLENATLNLNGNGTLKYMPSYGTGHGNNHYMIQIHGSATSQPNYSILNVGNSINLAAGSVTDHQSYDPYEAYAISVAPAYTKWGAKQNGDTHKAFGVVVNLNQCDIQGAVGINGMINAVDENAPKINISKDATITVTLDPSDGTNAIYAAGYGFWNIEGKVQGPTGVYVKAGSVTIDGATIIATGNYEEPTGNTNGTTGGGSAVILDTKGGYAGSMELVVKGNASISSENGYAVEELITEKAGEVTSQVSNVEITSGNFVGSDNAGCIKTTEEVEGKIVAAGSITGGIFNEDITAYVSSPNKVITYVDTEEGQKWTIGNIPSGQTWKSDFNTENSYVQLNSATPTKTEVTGTKNIAYLAILGQDSVIVKANARLNVGEVVLGEDAVLIIEPTAMVVVTSTQGIISTSDDQLIIKASTDGYGQLLINPGVTFNTQPRATVEITTRSFRKSSTEYLYERFAIPTGLMVDEVSCTNSKEVRFAKYDDDQDKWVVIGYLNATGSHNELNPNDLNVPFVDYQFLVNTPNAGEKVTFKCKLVGNADTEMQLKGHWWNGFGNSYVAEMDVEELLAVLKDKFQGSSENIAIYVYVCTNKELGIYEWKSITEMNLATKLKLNPMEVFLIKNDGNGITMPISYKDLLWDPATEPAE